MEDGPELEREALRTWARSYVRAVLALDGVRGTGAVAPSGGTPHPLADAS